MPLNTCSWRAARAALWHRHRANTELRAGEEEGLRFRVGCRACGGVAFEAEREEVGGDVDAGASEEARGRGPAGPAAAEEVGDEGEGEEGEGEGGGDCVQRLLEADGGALRLDGGDGLGVWRKRPKERMEARLSSARLCMPCSNALTRGRNPTFTTAASTAKPSVTSVGSTLPGKTNAISAVITNVIANLRTNSQTSYPHAST
eukprot:3548814-Rhodomonas_salina.1